MVWLLGHWRVLLGLAARSTLLAGVFLVAARARADDTPPRAIDIPVIEATEAEAPEEVNAVVTIDEAGIASLDACDSTPLWCARVSEALALSIFEPAARDGQPIASRVHVRLAIRAAPPPNVEPPMPSAGETASPSSEAGVAAPARRSAPRFAARARVLAPTGGMRRFELAELRDLPGAFGDPFRAIDALPGVTGVVSGLPYYYIRGAPPGATLHVYDEIPVPTLYHLALGPGVIHPRMIGPLRLYSGVAPARYGRAIGGVILAEGPETPGDNETHGEAEVRLLDVNGFITTQVGGTRVNVGVRYGYPALLLSLLVPLIDVQYWDYQLRTDTQLSARDRFSMVWLGSFDQLSVFQESSTFESTTDGGPVPERRVRTLATASTIMFHRLEARFVRDVPNGEVGVAFRLGFDESSAQNGDNLDGTVSFRSGIIGPRIWTSLRYPRTRLRLSAELYGTLGSLQLPGEFRDPTSRASAFRGALAGVAARTTGGLQGEASFDLASDLVLDLGVRFDAWSNSVSFEPAVDPRGRIRWKLDTETELSFALGRAHQGAVPAVPLPGLSELPLDRRLVSVVQSEIGITRDFGDELKIEARGFYHLFDGVLFPDLFAFPNRVCFTGDTRTCATAPFNARAAGSSYGAELFIHRPPRHSLAGWISYTLAWAELDATPGFRYTPSYDIRHVLNAVLRWEIVTGLSLGARVLWRSGAPRGQYYLDPAQVFSNPADALRRYEQRLPDFVRLDVQLAYAWDAGWARLRLAIEWFNVPLTQESTSLDCDVEPFATTPVRCTPEYLPAIWFASLGLRAEF